MDRMHLVEYAEENFEEFLSSLSSDVKFYSITYLLDEKANMKYTSFEDNTSKYLIDITTLVENARIRPDIRILHESMLNALNESDNEISYAIEQTSAKDAYKVFYHYFVPTQPETMQTPQLFASFTRKPLYSYTAEEFEEYCTERKTIGVTVLPLACVLDSRISAFPVLNNKIEANKSVEVDITSLVEEVSHREYLLEGEILLQTLFTYDNYSYVIDESQKDKAMKLFKHFFISDPIDTKHQHSHPRSIVEYSQDEFDRLVVEFNKKLFGHQTFKSDFFRQLRSFILLNKMKQRKVFSALICGKSGIGKTEVARALHTLMFSSCPTIKINFGNYSGKGSLWSLIGSPKGYMGSQQGGELTNKIRKSQSKVILIDELDKADEAIFTFFYEMLEDGQFTDLDGNVINLDGYIIIFTANLSNDNFREKIPEPLFSRFDITSEFFPLTTNEINEFKESFIEVLLASYAKHVNTDSDLVLLKNNLQSLSFIGKSNLRIIRRDIMNAFADFCQDQSVIQ